MEITKEKFLEWRQNSTTEEILKQLDAYRKDMKEFLAGGGTLGNEVETARVVGHIAGLSNIIDIEYEESSEERRENYEH